MPALPGVALRGGRALFDYLYDRDKLLTEIEVASLEPDWVELAARDLPRNGTDANGLVKVRRRKIRYKQHDLNLMSKCEASGRHKKPMQQSRNQFPIGDSIIALRGSNTVHSSRS